MKKILLLVLIFSLMYTGNISAFSTDAQKSDCEYAALVLDALNVCNADELEHSSEVTRAEFVKMAVCALGADSIASSWNSQIPFNDVSAEHPYKNHISVAHYLGIVGGYAGSQFRPDAAITFPEAVKILVSAVGFDEVAKSKGGYPGGYIAVASERKISDGVIAGTESVVCMADAVLMLYNAMNSEILSDVSYGTEKLYEISKGTTLMNNLLKQKGLVVTEGVVTTDSELSCDSSEEIEDGVIWIEGERYETEGVECNGLFGFRVEAYVDEKSGKIKSVFRLLHENSELTIDADDIEYFNIDEIGYCADGTDRTLKASVNKGSAVFMFNGREFLELKEDSLIPAVGTVHLISNDGNNDFEVVIIEEYKSFVVESVATQKRIIYLKKFAGKTVTFNGKPAIYLREDEDGYTSIMTDADGKTIDIADIKEDDVISVIASDDEKYIKIIVNNKFIEGVLTGIGEDSVTIDEKEYKLNSKNGWDPIEDVNIGDSAIFYLDIAGKVVMSDLKEQKYNYGYVVKSGTDGTLTKTYMLRLALSKSLTKVVDENDETDISYEARNEKIQDFIISENAKVNGVKVKDLSVLNLNDTLIRYTLDKDGKINKVENAEGWGTRDEYFFNADITSFGGLEGGFVMNESTNLICVPISGEEDEFYQVLKLNDDVSYDVQGFDVDSETSVAKAAVLKANMSPQGITAINNTSKVYIVTRVSQTLNSDGDECYRVSLLDKSKAIDVEVNTNQAVQGVVKNLKKGYLINYSVDAFDRMNAIKILARPVDYSVPQLLREMQTNEEAYGPLTEVRTNIFSAFENEMVNRVTVEYSESGLTKFYDIPTDNPPPVYLYNRSSDTVTNVSPSDFLSKEIVGSDANDVFVAACEGEVRAVVVFE